MSDVIAITTGDGWIYGIDFARPNSDSSVRVKFCHLTDGSIHVVALEKWDQIKMQWGPA